MACCVVGGQTGHIRVTTERRLGNSHGSHLLRGLWRLITELELTIVTTQYSASLKHLHQLRNPQQTCLWLLLLLLLMNKYLTFEVDRVCTGKQRMCQWHANFFYSDLLIYSEIHTNYIDSNKMFQWWANFTFLNKNS